MFLDWGLNLCLVRRQVDSLPLSPGKPRLPFSSCLVASGLTYRRQRRPLWCEGSAVAVRTQLPRGIWDVITSSPSRDRTHGPCLGRQVPNHCATREVFIVFWFVFPGDAVVKNPPASPGDARDTSSVLSWEDPWNRKRQPTPVFLPGKSHGQRSLWPAQSTGSQRVGHNLATQHALTHSSW